ncbi:MAG: restriction endonuclease subunit R [Phormidesmis sp.]
MVLQTIPATKITLYDLEQRFNLEQVQSPSFFEEWQTALVPLSDVEKQRLKRVELSVANLERRSLLENTVKLAVLAPLLDLSGLFLPPFYVSTEDAVTIEAADDSFMVQGRIDILVLREELWLLVIESKRAEFSPKVGIPQALSYMLAAPQRAQPVYGLVTNGTDFVFLKLVFGEVPRYGRSRQFVLGQDQDLEQVLQVLKHLAEVLKATGE